MPLTTKRDRKEPRIRILFYLNVKDDPIRDVTYHRSVPLPDIGRKVPIGSKLYMVSDHYYWYEKDRVDVGILLTDISEHEETLEEGAAEEDDQESE